MTTNELQERINIIQNLVKPIIGIYKRSYKDNREDGNRLVYCGVELTKTNEENNYDPCCKFK